MRQQPGCSWRCGFWGAGFFHDNVIRRIFGDILFVRSDLEGLQLLRDGRSEPPLRRAIDDASGFSPSRLRDSNGRRKQRFAVGFRLVGLELRSSTARGPYPWPGSGSIHSDLRRPASARGIGIGRLSNKAVTFSSSPTPPCAEVRSNRARTAPLASKGAGICTLSEASFGERDLFHRTSAFRHHHFSTTE